MEKGRGVEYGRTTYVDIETGEVFNSKEVKHLLYKIMNKTQTKRKNHTNGKTRIETVQEIRVLAKQLQFEGMD